MIRAVLFDFNGTLSQDEPVWFEVYRDVLAAHGRPITRAEYFEHLTGLSDAEAAVAWLGPEYPRLADVAEEGVARFRTLAGDGSTVPQAAREAVAVAAAGEIVDVLDADCVRQLLAS